MSGPVRGVPLTFSIHESAYSDVHQPVFVSPATGNPFSDAAQTTRNDGSTLAVSAVYSVPRVRVRANFFDSRMTLAHAGIGALIAAGAGSSIASSNMQFQTSWRISGDTWIERGGVSWRRDSLDATADSQNAAIIVTQQSISGGSDVAAETRRSSAWTARNVFESAGGGHSWLVGAEVAHDDVRDPQQPNPSGRLQLPSLDAATGTWFVTRGTAAAAASTSSAALFGQRILADSRRLTVRAGLRADWQNRDGVIFSPRLAMRVLAPAGVQIGVGAGVFADTINPNILLEVARRSGSEAQLFVVPGIAPSDIAAASASAGFPLTARFSPDFTRRKDVVVRAVVQRQFGRWNVGAEHTWTEGLDLAGSARRLGSGTLVDLIASDRHLRRQQTHARATAAWKHHSLVIHYEHARSFDDTDGPLSFPERSDDLSNEWGPSFSVSRHSFGVVAALKLPAAVQISLAFDARSGRPFNILTGGDAEGLATYTDRGGLPRNEGIGPSTRTLSAFIYRPIVLKRLRGIKFDAGVRLENLLNTENVTTVGQVANSALFGRALAAETGRSVRVWLTAGR